jgi:hypothetical protein
MTNLLDLFKEQMGGGLLQQLGSQVGINEPEKAENAATGAFSVLMGALQKNASQSGGASILSSVLDRDHDGSILDDVTGYFTGNTQVSNTKTTDGAGILGHLLGDKQDSIFDQVASMTGIDKNSSAGLLAKLAPIAMGMLGKMKKENNLDENGLKDVLAQSVEPAKKDSMLGGLLTSFLDKDGDGNVMDDLGQMGLDAVLKGFLGKK